MAIKIVEKKRKREERRPVVKSIHKLKVKKKKKELFLGLITSQCP